MSLESKRILRGACGAAQNAPELEIQKSAFFVLNASSGPPAPWILCAPGEQDTIPVPRPDRSATIYLGNINHKNETKSANSDGKHKTHYLGSAQMVTTRLMRSDSSIKSAEKCGVWVGEGAE